MNRNKCPEYADLEDYACGIPGDGQTVQIERHLDDCPACTKSFTVLETSTEGLLGQLREQSKSSGLESLSEPKFRHAVESICRHDFTRIRLQDQAMAGRSFHRPSNRMFDLTPFIGLPTFSRSLRG